MSEKSTETFEQQFLGGVWYKSPIRIEVEKLLKEYEEKTEAYDRTVCTGPIVRGSIMPATLNERMLITRNALKLMKEIEDKILAKCFSREEWLEALQCRKMIHGRPPNT